MFALILKSFKIIYLLLFWVNLSSISDSTVTKLDFDLEPEPPPAPPRDSSLGEINESAEFNTPGPASHFELRIFTI